VLADKESECARITRELETVAKELVHKSADACEKAEAAEKGKLEAVALQAEIDKMKKKAVETDEELARAKGKAATLRTDVETIHQRALEKDDLAARAQREADINRAATVEEAAEIRTLRDEVADLQAKALQHSSVACELEAAKAETQKLRKEIVDLQATRLNRTWRVLLAIIDAAGILIDIVLVASCSHPRRRPPHRHPTRRVLLAIIHAAGLLIDIVLVASYCTTSHRLSR